MSRQSVRVGIAQLLGGLKNGDGSAMFRAVYPVMPTRIDKRLSPAAVVMVPREKRVRRGPMQKHANYTAQALLLWSAPSVDWQSPTAPSTVWVAPVSEPQTQFDGWLDAFCRALEQNKSFPQDVPESGVQVIQIGEPAIDVSTSEPVLEGELVVCAAIVSFPVAEQILGV